MSNTSKQCRLHVPATSSIRLSRSGPLYTCSNHPRARHQTTQGGTYTPDLTEIIHTSQSDVCSSCLAGSSPTEATINAPAYISPLLPLPPARLWFFLVGLHGMVCPCLLGSVSNRPSFQGQSSPGLLVSLYLNNNKTYVLKDFCKFFAYAPGPRLPSRLPHIFFL